MMWFWLLVVLGTIALGFVSAGVWMLNERKGRRARKDDGAK